MLEVQADGIGRLADDASDLEVHRGGRASDGRAPWGETSAAPARPPEPRPRRSTRSRRLLCGFSAAHTMGQPTFAPAEAVHRTERANVKCRSLRAGDTLSCRPPTHGGPRAPARPADPFCPRNCPGPLGRIHLRARVRLRKLVLRRGAARRPGRGAARQRLHHRIRSRPGARFAPRLQHPRVRRIEADAPGHRLEHHHLGSRRRRVRRRERRVVLAVQFLPAADRPLGRSGADRLRATASWARPRPKTAACSTWGVRGEYFLSPNVSVGCALPLLPSQLLELHPRLRQPRHPGEHRGSSAGLGRLVLDGRAQLGVLLPVGGAPK